MKVDDFKKKLVPKNRAKWNTIGCFKSYTYAAFKETYKKNGYVPTLNWLKALDFLLVCKLQTDS